MELLAFYLFAAIAVGTALAVVFQKRAVYAALCLILCLGAIAGLFIQMEAYFMGAIQMIVYAGAIMVLFLFVIMLLDPQSEVFRIRKQHLIVIAVSTLALILGYTLASTLAGQPSDAPLSLAEKGSIDAIARVLFRDYLLPFELTSILILVAVVGAMVLAKQHK